MQPSSRWEDRDKIDVRNWIGGLNAPRSFTPSDLEDDRVGVQFFRIIGGPMPPGSIINNEIRVHVTAACKRKFSKAKVREGAHYYSPDQQTKLLKWAARLRLGSPVQRNCLACFPPAVAGSSSCTFQRVQLRGAWSSLLVGQGSPGGPTASQGSICCYLFALNEKVVPPRKPFLS